MNMFRDSSVDISSAVRWKLVRIAKGLNQTPKDKLEMPYSVNQLADDILSQWISNNYPVLDELWDKRENIEQEAIAVVTAKSAQPAAPSEFIPPPSV